ncbi:MAG: tetratricopeptide repeat protein [Candidatus Bruticola sp.]
MADTIEGLMQEARAFADSRSWDQAIESYSRVIDLDADNDEACRSLANIYALRGMFKSVISTYLRLMHIYVARSDMDNAMAVANYVLLLEPASIDVRSELINMYRYRGDTAEVVSRSLDLARLYTELDEGDRSIELLQAVLNDDPNNADICRELAEMYIQYGQVERGASQYHQVADLYQANGQLDKACDALERILVVNSGDSGAVFHLGELYSMMERWEDAERQFRSALKFDFENLDVMFALGNVCQRKGDLDQASLAYRKIVMIAPDYVLAQERLGEIYHMQNNIELAIKAYLTAGGLYVRSNDSEHAIALYQRVIFLDPNNPAATRELTNLGAPVVGNDGGIQPLVKNKAATKSSRSESRREKKDGERKTRSGLLPKGGGGVRSGLVAKGGGSKPGLGGKPVLGGDGEAEGAPRPGLMRAGLKASGGGKPSLGGKPMLGGKRVLGSRKKKAEEAKEEAPVEHTAISLAKEPENDQSAAVENVAANDGEVQAAEVVAVESGVDEVMPTPEHVESSESQPEVGTVAEAVPEVGAAIPESAGDIHSEMTPEHNPEAFSASEHQVPLEDNIYADGNQQYVGEDQQFGGDMQQYAGEAHQFGGDMQQYAGEAQQFGNDMQQYAGEVQQFGSDMQQYADDSQQFGGDMQQYVGAEQGQGHEYYQEPYAAQTGEFYGEHADGTGHFEQPTESHEAYYQQEGTAAEYGEQHQYEDAAYGGENYSDNGYGFDMHRPLIMVPEGELIVPAPILYLERTDLYEAICQAITEVPDPSVIPWEPLRVIDEAAIEEKLAQQSAEAARAAAEAEEAARAEAEKEQAASSSVEGFDFSGGVNLKGVSGTGLRRKYSKGESKGSSSSGRSRLSGNQSLSERVARMRAESAELEESASEHRAISGINRHHQDKSQKKEKGRSIVGGISRPINQVIEEANQANQANGTAPQTYADQAPEIPRPELTATRSRSSLSERIKRARQSKAAAKVQAEEVNAELSAQSVEQPVAEFDGNAYQAESQEAVNTSAASAEYGAPTAPDGQLSGEYEAYQAAEQAASDPSASELGLAQVAVGAVAIGAVAAASSAVADNLDDLTQGEYPIESGAEAEQLGGQYGAYPEAEQANEGEQLGGQYGAYPEAGQAAEGEQLGGQYGAYPEAEHAAEAEQLGGQYGAYPEAEHAAEADTSGVGLAKVAVGAVAIGAVAAASSTVADNFSGAELYADTAAEELLGEQYGGGENVEAEPAAVVEEEQLGAHYSAYPEAEPAAEADTSGVGLAKVAVGAVAIGAVAAASSTVADNFSDAELYTEAVSEEQFSGQYEAEPVEAEPAAAEAEQLDGDYGNYADAVEQAVNSGVGLAKVAVGAVAIGAVAAASSAVADNFGDLEQYASYPDADGAPVSEPVAQIEDRQLNKANANPSRDVAEEVQSVETPVAVADELDTSSNDDNAQVVELDEAGASMIEFVEVDDDRTDVPEIVLNEPDEVATPTKVKVPVRIKRRKRRSAPVIEQIEEVEEIEADLPQGDAGSDASSGVGLAKVAVGAVAIGAVAAASSMVADNFAANASELYQQDAQSEFIEAENIHEESAVAEAEPEEVQPEPEPEPVGDELCSLSVESELPPEYLKEAQRLRDKLVGADVTTAIGDYRRAIENSPENLVLRTDLADVHLRFSLMDDAINQYRQILRRKPDSVALRHRLACAHLWNEDFDEAIKVYLDLAELHTQNEQYADVIDVLQTVLSLDPQHFKARRLLIDRFIAQGKVDLATHHLRQFVDAALSLGSVDNAIFALKQLIELSDDPAFVERLAKVYEEHDNVSEAISYYQILSERYRKEEKWSEALAVCSKLVALEPDNFDERRLLISLYQNLGRYDKAMAEQFHLAGLYKEQNSMDEAAELYQSIVDKDPGHYAARRCLVDCYLSKGNLQAAMMQVAPLTERYRSERLFEQAIEMYRSLVEADPSSVDLREELLAFYTMGEQRENMLSELLTLNEIHENKGEYRDSVRYLRRAIELAPDRADLHCRLAKLYDEQLQSISGAMQEYRKVFELNPGDAEAMSRYAQLLVSQRKPKEAAAVLLKLQSINKEVGKQAINTICKSFLDKIAQDGADLATRYSYGELCYYLNRISDAIEQFQKTHADRDLELRSRNMLGLSFIKMPRMREMAIRQFRLGLDTKGHAEQDYLELRYNLAMLFYQTDRLQEALTEFKSILAFDITYRDVEARVKDLQAKIAAGGGASKGRGVPPRRK